MGGKPMAKPKREIKEEKQRRAKLIVAGLKKRYPRARTALHYSTAHELLVATVLAAQCTDKKVNEITPRLFEKYPTPAAFARARQATLEQEIRQAGFFRNKAKAIIALSKDIVGNFGGEVPDNIEGLTSLHGVGRKTANVVLAAVFGRPAVIVDTHMIRLANRLGLTAKKDPVKIEFDLMGVIPARQWGDFSFMITLHGRQVCKARRPLCNVCPIEKLCPSSTLRHEA
jgi:endonuclease-3